MKICRSIAECRAALGVFRHAHETIALVPTMGYLHAGHMALVERAGQVAQRKAVSIFVNPTQFGDDGDLDAYPRDEARDLAMLEEAGTDVVFLPGVENMYPSGDETIVETTRLANMLHGAVRPGHFRGVTTVVARLFNIFQPDFACFGEKDYQQLQVIRRMVRDLAFNLEIVPVATVREEDGLAMSSRNVRLSPQDRVAALVLSRALEAAEQAVVSGTSVEALRTLITDMIASEPRGELTGLDIVRAVTLDEISGPLTDDAAIMLSVQFGDVMLIDQRELFPGRS